MSKTIRVCLNGVSPLVMHNNRCVNPRDPLKKAIAAITGKGKRKTEADLDELERLEFVAGLYYDEEMGPYIPSNNIRKMLIEGARKVKMGKQFESGVFVTRDVPVEYDGPRDFEKMWELRDKFAWTTVVGNQKASILRTRPRFKQWKIEFSVILEESLVSVDDLKTALKHAEIAVGLCDGRSVGCGRFDAEVLG